MKKTIIIFLLLIIIFNTNTCLAHKMPEELIFSDYCGIISEGVKDYVNSKNDILYSKTKAKIIYVVSNSSSRNNANDFAKDLYSSWNIARLGRGNSVFVLICPRLDDYAIIQGNNIKRALTDDIIYRIISESFEPYIAKGDYDGAVMSLYNAIGGWYEDNYNELKLDLAQDFAPYKSGEKEALIEKNTDAIWLCVFGAVCLIFVVAFLKTKKKIDFKKRQQERRIRRKRSKADIDKIVNS